MTSLSDQMRVEEIEDSDLLESTPAPSAALSVPALGEDLPVLSVVPPTPTVPSISIAHTPELPDDKDDWGSERRQSAGSDELIVDDSPSKRSSNLNLKTSPGSQMFTPRASVLMDPDQAKGYKDRKSASSTSNKSMRTRASGARRSSRVIDDPGSADELASSVGGGGSAAARTAGPGTALEPPKSAESQAYKVVESMQFSEITPLGTASLAASSPSTAIDASDTLNKDDAEEHLEKRACCHSVTAARKKVAPRVRIFIKGKAFQIVMLLCLLAALFLPDCWILANRPDNSDLDIVLTIVLVMFVVELTLQAVGQFETYFGSFFFWMDLLGGISLLLDLTYVGAESLLEGDNSKGKSDSVSGNVVVMRAARIAKLGARAGRFSRLVKLLRFLPGMGGAQVDAGTAKIIAAKLTHSLATRVSCLIILMVMIMPMLSMFTYPEMDLSKKSWLQHLQTIALRHPHRLGDELIAFSAFFEDGAGAAGGYYPWTCRANEGNALNETALAHLPWFASRGPPSRIANSNFIYADDFLCEFNFEKPNQTDAICNVSLLFLIMILMTSFALLLSNAVSSIVLRPLEKMLLQVRKMGARIFQSVADITKTMNDTVEGAKETKEEEDEDEENGNVQDFVSNETELLEMVVHKLSTLSEITQFSKPNDSKQNVEGLAERDREVIDGFEGLGETRVAIYLGENGDKIWEDDAQDANYDMMDAQRRVVENVGLSLEVVNSWGLNPLELDKVRNQASAMYFLGPHNHGIAIDENVMAGFLEAVEAGYLKTAPFHNWFHAIDVAHCVYRLLNICACDQFLSAAERFALLVSAIGHDIGHPGVNNAFLISTGHELAQIYNDRSPLENMHCAKLFELTTMPKNNIFASISIRHYQVVRTRCIEAIMHTDNAQHFPMVKDLQMMIEVNSEIVGFARDIYLDEPDEYPPIEAIECFRHPESRRLIANILLHAADISQVAKPFRICRYWAHQVCEEYFLQGDQEKKLGIPVQPLTDRDTLNRAFMQIGVIQFFVSPLAFAVMRLLPPFEPLVETMLGNAKAWHQQWLEETKPPPTDQQKKQLSDRIHKLEVRFQENRTLR